MEAKSKIKVAPVRSGYYMAKVLDCYYDTIHTLNGNKDVLRINIKIRCEEIFYTIETITFCDEYDYSDYGKLIKQILSEFGLEEFSPEYLICRFVNVNLTTRCDSKGNEYMKILSITPYSSNK